MGYYIDLKALHLDEYKEILRAADLLPSRMILKENIDEVFSILKVHKIETVDDIQSTLKNKKRLQDFSKATGLPEDYLKILVREVNSYRQKPNQIKDFPHISEDGIMELEKLGLKNTLQLFDKVLTPQSREELSRRTGIDTDEIMRLTRLTDLTRIRWVNHTFAYVLLQAGYDSAERVAEADPAVLHEKVNKLNEEKGFYKGHIGLHDMKLCVEAAKDVPLEIQY